jgi:hypothetical protein
MTRVTGQTLVHLRSACIARPVQCKLAASLDGGQLQPASTQTPIGVGPGAQT